MSTILCLLRKLVWTAVVMEATCSFYKIWKYRFSKPISHGVFSDQFCVAVSDLFRVEENVNEDCDLVILRNLDAEEQRFWNITLRVTETLNRQKRQDLVQGMHSSTKLQSPPLSVVFHYFCDKVYHKQEVHFFVFTRSDCYLTI